MQIKFGPAGIGPVSEVEKTFEEYKKLGIRSVEIPFTYGIYIKDKEVANKIKRASEKFEIQLSIHAPYWINLNSAEEEKVQKSKERILKCCEVGNWLGAKVVVFHSGYYGKSSREKVFDKIKNEILEMQKILKEKKFSPKLAPETMGKINVFGSIEEINKLVEETNCSFCLDFAHILARDKKVDWEKIKKLFPQKNWHCHFSGIEYGAKGERHHKITEEKNWKEVLKNLPRDREIVIINESPSPVEDSVTGIKISKLLSNN